jgi:XTP/dITP diphosphohydrolase
VNIDFMPELLLATNNPGKVKEFRDILQGIPFELVTPAMLGIHLEVAETGNTYRENAALKARAFCQAGGLLTLADDSGLEVDALQGEPGIRSSRYAGEGAADADRVRFLLDKLKDVTWEKRTARFRCVIAVVAPSGRIDYFEGQCDGMIGFENRGTNGFGYDPIFYFPEYQRTMAELSEETKNLISHRARAAQQAIQFLGKL